MELLLVLVVAFYFLPTLIAVMRSHRNLAGVILLNLLAGWTFIGWVGALIWSVWAGASTAEPNYYVPPPDGEA